MGEEGGGGGKREKGRGRRGKWPLRSSCCCPALAQCRTWVPSFSLTTAPTQEVFSWPLLQEEETEAQRDQAAFGRLHIQPRSNTGLVPVPV